MGLFNSLVKSERVTTAALIAFGLCAYFVTAYGIVTGIMSYYTYAVIF